LAAGALALVGCSAELVAQGQRQSGVMAVSATVVRSCSVQVGAVPAQPTPLDSPSGIKSQPAVTVNCGSDQVTYPPGSGAASSSTRSALPSVTVTGTTRVTIEF